MLDGNWLTEKSVGELIHFEIRTKSFRWREKYFACKMSQEIDLTVENILKKKSMFLS